MYAGRWTRIATFLNRRELWIIVCWSVFTFEKLRRGNRACQTVIILEIVLPLVSFFHTIICLSVAQAIHYHLMVNLSFGLIFAGNGNHDGEAHSFLTRMDSSRYVRLSKL